MAAGHRNISLPKSASYLKKGKNSDLDMWSCWPRDKFWVIAAIC
jgi:hypothetical protein